MQLPSGLRAFDWLIGRPIAHRGLHDSKRGVIENTRSAFAAAIASNYAIECDVQLTADGEAVMFHDNTLDRLTLAQGLVIARTAAELTSIALRGSTDRIGTLADLLAQVRGRVPLIIELKSAWDGNVTLALRALEVLQSYAGPYGVMSFDPDLVEALRQAPQTPRGIVAERVSRTSWQGMPLARRLELRHLRHWQRTLPHFISFDAGGLPWPPVTQLRAAGLPVITWTVRSEDEAAAVRRYCDQITFEGFLP
ncbi:MAG: glycerophosphodiester phosphodiesterase family protein [Aestuariivirgaceae bacterium]